MSAGCGLCSVLSALRTSHSVPAGLHGHHPQRKYDWCWMNAGRNRKACCALP